MTAQNTKYLNWPATVCLILLSGCFAIASVGLGYEGFKELAAVSALADSDAMVEYTDAVSESDEPEAPSNDFEAVPTGAMPPGYTVSWLAKSRNFHYCSRAGLYPQDFPPE